MKFNRGSGLLLHISSLPSKFGIGDFGPGAYRFVDFLKQSGQRYWQVLPLNPTDQLYGNSPYSSFSAFAVNPLLISPELLLEDGLLAKEDMKGDIDFSEDKIDFKDVVPFKQKLLGAAYNRFKKTKVLNEEFLSFCGQCKEWIDGYALYLTMKQKFKGASWIKWPESCKDMKRILPSALSDFPDEVEKAKFIQFTAFRQWFQLREYCTQKQIQVIGDIPIYVNLDSSDVWARPELFKLDQAFNPLFVAGVPPDYFSATGQLWGNPVYNWDLMRQNRFSWWKKRVEMMFDLYDILRIDHFRGFVACWEIPAGEATAINGKWVGAPAEEFFSALTDEFGQAPIIAEDLGIITPDVTDLMNRFGFPGMKVLQFAFNGDQSTHPYIPEHYQSEECVVYTGTHDNNTTLGWWKHDATNEEKENLKRYVMDHFHAAVDEKNIHWELVKIALNSKADIALIPLQDVLGLGREARMNVPSTPSGNWEWRVREPMLSVSVASRLLELTKGSRRGPAI